jgi:ATP-dependent Lhr-like helicase
MSNSDILASLEGLVWKGIVVNDSFESIRYFIAESGSSIKGKAKKRANAYKSEMGRWEIAQGIVQLKLEDYILILFKRYGLLTKEIFQYEKTQQLWKEAYEVLKQWEYIGKVNRGYYIEGLSGMQFILPECSHMLDNPSGQYIVLNTCDPAQAYGQIIPRNIEKSMWICTNGNAVVIKEGKPVITAEGYGERINTYADNYEEISCALNAFVDAFHLGQVWSSRNRIRLKYWNNEQCTKCMFTEELYKLGFEPEMMEMVLWKRV